MRIQFFGVTSSEIVRVLLSPLFLVSYAYIAVHFRECVQGARYSLKKKKKKAISLYGKYRTVPRKQG